MATVPANATLATWIGSGCGITANSTSAGAGYWIPKEVVDEFVGAVGNTAISDDIRDFLFSVLTLCAKSYSQEVGAGDTRVQNTVVTQAISGTTVTFAVRLSGVTVSQPIYIASLPSYS